MSSLTEDSVSGNCGANGICAMRSRERSRENKLVSACSLKSTVRDCHDGDCKAETTDVFQISACAAMAYAVFRESANHITRR